MDCLTCNRIGTTHHVHNLNLALEDSSQSSGIPTLTKPTAPPDHWISTLTKAVLDNDMDEMKHLNQLYSKVTGESPDYLMYDRSEIKKIILHSQENH